MFHAINDARPLKGIEISFYWKMDIKYGWQDGLTVPHAWVQDDRYIPVLGIT